MSMNPPKNPENAKKATMLKLKSPKAIMFSNLKKLRVLYIKINRQDIQ